ncbi:dual oxidase maturation factor 1-like [Littorina saxatilis]|uniref:Dual oxidase maturation factor 1 n=1 Tax=Littorina saxatilis TaxID=31220 RepID=A0AAN9GJZ0_9CAEN
MSGLYQAFRSNGAPTFYEAMHTAVEADIVEAGLIFCFVILTFSFFVVLPGIRGNERIFAFIRITLSLWVGAVILVSNFAMTWESGKVVTETKYKAGTGKEVHAEVGVQIGLRGINVTLKGEPEQQLNETINYNEHFSWEWRQGRLGFGPFAGRFQQEYRAAQFRGLPLPILWAAEYFTFDGEGIRWGRFYRQAGWYSHIVLWFAFPLWILTNILFFVLLRYGAYMLAMTGAAMVTANIIWATLRNVNELVIPFTAEHMIEFTFGGSFYACLITGLGCIVLGALVFFMDLRYPQHIALFFNVDIIQDSEEVQVEKEEPVMKPKKEDEDSDEEEDKNYQDAGSPDTGEASGAAGGRPPLRTPSVGSHDGNPDDDIYIAFGDDAQERRPARGFTQRMTKRFQKPRRRPPPSPPGEHGVVDPLYDNNFFPTNDDIYANNAFEMEDVTPLAN